MRSILNRNARPLARILLAGFLIASIAHVVAGAPPRRARPLRAERAPAEGAQPDKSADETWQVIYVGKNRIGYSWTVSRLVTLVRREYVLEEDARGKQVSASRLRPVDGRVLRNTETQMRMALKRFGETIHLESRQVFEDSADGEMQSFVFEVKNPPAAPLRTAGRVQDGRLVGESNIGGTNREFSMPLEQGTRSPAFLDRLPQERPFKTGDSLSYKVFMPEQMQASDVRLSAGRLESVAMLDGRRQKLLKLTAMSSILPQSPLTSYVDERGRTMLSSTQIFNQELLTYTVDAGEALKEMAGEELDIALSTLVRSTAIPNAHRLRRAVYRIRVRGEDPTPLFPNEGGQKAIRKGPEECEVIVRAVAPTPTNRSVRVDRQYRVGSRYLQITDPDVLMHVDRAARNRTDSVQIAVAMERYVYEKLQKKNFSTALGSAAEVAKTMQGDCTEHAVLLAAMLRVRNIPSRIAVGLVYIEPLAAFGGHMWTEALIGDRWIPLDATLGLGGTGAAHLKLADSSLSDDGPAPFGVFLPLVRVLGRIELTVVEASMN